MSSPFIRTDATGRIIGRYSRGKPKDDEFSRDIPAATIYAVPPAGIADEPAGQPIAPGGTVSGVIDFTGDLDTYTIDLTAGQTYLFSLRGTGASPLNDSLLRLATLAGAVFAFDDDGGNDLYSLLTYTPTVDETILIAASAFPNAGDPGLGGYTVDVRVQGADAVGDTNATAAALSLGTTFGFRETGTGGDPIDPILAGDLDRYAVNLTAGQYYTFKVAGGADYLTDWFDVPTGELDTVLILRDAAGTILELNDDNNFPSDISSGIGFFAETSGTYYLDVTAYAGNTGGYAVDFQQIDVSQFDPLDSIRWKSANDVPFAATEGIPTAYVYFAPAGENFGELADDGSPMVTFGWNAYEKQQVMQALNEFSKVLGVRYVATNDVDKATFRLLTTESQLYGAYFYPQDPQFGSAQGIGVFNVLSGGWSLPGQASLQRGGFSYAVILHEFGHAHGLAHPHDTGGGSDVMLGVTGPFGSYGLFDLNQGVYTVMSYNDAWERHPDGPSPFTQATIGQGWSGSLSAFDIAALQERYGEGSYRNGNDVYRLQDANATGTFYETIWDTGGNDTIRYDGNRDAQIDLIAATLDYSATGGGVVSFVDDIWGGYTIANGVAIENAVGGGGNDVLLGNELANRIEGRGGNDTLFGREGNDTVSGSTGDDTLNGGDGLDFLLLGHGNDVAVADLGGPTYVTNRGTFTIDVIGDFRTGFDLIDLSSLGTLTFRGTGANTNPGDVTYETFASVGAAVSALGFNFASGLPANPGPVTIVYANEDGGSPDLALVLYDKRGVVAADLQIATVAVAIPNSNQFDYFQA